MIEKIEKNIFFKVTRIFAWLIIAPAFLILLYSGYKSLKSFITPSSPVVTYNEVKSIMEGKTNYSDFEGKKSQKSARESKFDYRKAMDNLLDAFGSQINREKGEELFEKRLSAVDEKDQSRYMDGLISVVKSAPEGDKRFDATDTYHQLWLTKKIAIIGKESSDVLNKPLYLGLLAGSLSIISVFSLVLILLTIEKNTRKTEKS
jgi:hypothetical protein